MLMPSASDLSTRSGLLLTVIAPLAGTPEYFSQHLERAESHRRGLQMVC